MPRSPTRRTPCSIWGGGHKLGLRILPLTWQLQLCWKARKRFFSRQAKSPGGSGLASGGHKRVLEHKARKQSLLTGEECPDGWVLSLLNIALKQHLIRCAGSEAIYKGQSRDIWRQIRAPLAILDLSQA